MSLHSGAIDLKNNVVFIEKSKGKRFRAVPLNTRARETLVELGDQYFSPISAATVSQKFNDLMKRLGFTNFKLHSLRHTFATQLVSKGVDLYSVKEILGHTDIRTSMIYGKADTETLRRAVSKLDEE